ncbi:hypothetical protein KIW84_044013 [Lathyrus oleraceus]|uniref:CCHC-type domain-containing protein n=1 Tax=Pisum sativum TaxID=3888 RepID=A0A9D4XJI5_PEA|nr:hypothetical protein KIW84_044013 [Pisum sativum]
MDKSLPELLAMLRTAKQNLKSKGKSILMIGNGKRQNKRPTKQGEKGKGKEAAKPRPTVAALKPSGGIAKADTCFHCGKTEHWKRNCPKYLEDMKNGGLKRSRDLAKGEVDIRVSNGAKVVVLAFCRIFGQESFGLHNHNFKEVLNIIWRPNLEEYHLENYLDEACKARKLR